MNPHDEMNTIIHDALRRDLDRVEAALQQPLGDDRRTALCGHVIWMLDVLHHHHVGEDEGVWPRVLAKRPDLQPMVDEMEAEHETLAAASAWPLLHMRRTGPSGTARRWLRPLST